MFIALSKLKFKTTSNTGLVPLEEAGTGSGRVDVPSRGSFQRRQTRKNEWAYPVAGLNPDQNPHAGTPGLVPSGMANAIKPIAKLGKNLRAEPLVRSVQVPVSSIQILFLVIVSNAGDSILT